MRGSPDMDESVTYVTADVIVLGCTLPGIVVAHKLKHMFGNTIEIVVLDLADHRKLDRKHHDVTFLGVKDDDEDEGFSDQLSTNYNSLAVALIKKYARELHFPFPDAMTSPSITRNMLNKVFQYKDGSAVCCTESYHEFTFLTYYEQLELSQYQDLINRSMLNLFNYNNAPSDHERNLLLYYDRTTMEQHICSALLFSTPREIMRLTVRLVCGASPDTVSVLFYLHQCHRTSNCRNHLDGDNLRLREKVIGYCRKKITSKLQASIADITVTAKSITDIKSYADEKVILESLTGDIYYVCNLLAMALNPDELQKINVETQLLSGREIEITQEMLPGRGKKFYIHYEYQFWRDAGYSGDILSIQGPIIWAMENTKITAGNIESIACIVGYLKVSGENVSSKNSSKDEVIQQLVSLFGEQAAKPTKYSESVLNDIYLPRCGSYVAFRDITSKWVTQKLEWSALDVYADGDIAASLEAGNVAYLHLVQCLRPQAQTYDDLSVLDSRTKIDYPLLSGLLCQLNYVQSLRIVAYTTALYLGYKLVRMYWHK